MIHAAHASHVVACMRPSDRSVRILEEAATKKTFVVTGRVRLTQVSKYLRTRTKAGRPSLICRALQVPRYLAECDLCSLPAEKSATHASFQPFIPGPFRGESTGLPRHSVSSTQLAPGTCGRALLCAATAGLAAALLP